MQYKHEDLVSVKILINSYQKINIYLNVVSLIETDIFMVSGHNCINGKSIMSILNLDILKPVTVYNIPASFVEGLRRLEI